MNAYAEPVLTTSSLSFADSKNAKFLSPFCHQQPWSLPDSIVYYMTKNPSSAKSYVKMIQSCKHFFIKKPLFLAPKLCFIENIAHNKTTQKPYNFKNASIEIWATGGLCIHRNQNTTLLPTMYKCDVKELTLWGPLTISFKDFIFLVSKCEYFCAQNAIIMNENDSFVSLEKVVAALPNIKDFDYMNYDPPSIISPNTASELLKIPHFSNLNSFEVSGIPEDFDIYRFYDFIKRNKKIEFSLNFCDQLSDAYTGHLQTIVDEIVAAKNHD